MKSTVYNLETETEYVFCLEPLEALISAAILEDKKASLLTDAATRKKYSQKIRHGILSSTIGDLSVMMRTGAAA